MAELATSKRAARPWRGVPVAARQLLAVGLVSDFGTGLVVPFLAVYAARTRGVGTTVGASTVAVFAAACLLSNVAAGRLADRTGPRRVVQAGWLIQAVAEVGLTYAATPKTLLLAAAGMGFGAGAAYPALRALLAQVTGPERRGFVFGTQHGLLNMALAGGTLTSALILTPPTLGRFQLLYLADAVTFAAAAVLLARIADAPADSGGAPTAVLEAQPPASDGVTGYRAVITDRRLLSACWVQALLVIFGYSQYHAALPLIAARPGGLSAGHLAVVYAVNAVTVSLAAFPMALAATPPRRRWLIASGAVCFASTWPLLAAADQFGNTSAALLLAAGGAAAMGIGEAALAPTLGPLPNDLAPPRLRTRYNSVEALTLSAGSIIGPAVTGLLLAYGSPTALLAVLGGGCLLAAGSASALHIPDPR